MRAFLLFLFLLPAPVACAGAPAKPKPEPTLAADPELPLSFPATSSTSNLSQDAGSPSDGCIVVQADFATHPAAIEGILAKSEEAKTTAPFVLRLPRPRCIIGLPRASFVTEVFVASSNADLRPLIGARVRLTGDAIGGTTDLGAPAVILLAKDIERAPPPPSDP